MGMSEFYGAGNERDDEESIRTIHRALEIGVNFLDTADMYGPYKNENWEVIWKSQPSDSAVWECRNFTVRRKVVMKRNQSTRFTALWKSE